jgi:hypothetical protein
VKIVIEYEVKGSPYPEEEPDNFEVVHQHHVENPVTPWIGEIVEGSVEDFIAELTEEIAHQLTAEQIRGTWRSPSEGDPPHEQAGGRGGEI